MPVLRRKQVRNFTVLPNEMLQDPRLSCRDRGLLVWMLSKPQDWAFSQRGIANELSFDGESSVKAGVKNLQKAGYLHIDRERRDRGRLSAAVWTVSDSPQLESQSMGPPQVDLPLVENRPYTKKRGTKEEPATPAFGGGQKPGLYFDNKEGIWRKQVE